MIDKIKNVVEDMYEDEAKHLLQSILIQLDLLEENYSEDTIKHLISIPKQLTSNTSYKKNVKESTHIHIAFDDSTTGCLKYMLVKKNYLRRVLLHSLNSFQLDRLINYIRIKGNSQDSNGY